MSREIAADVIERLAAPRHHDQLTRRRFLIEAARKPRRYRTRRSVDRFKGDGRAFSVGQRYGWCCGDAAAERQRGRDGNNSHRTAAVRNTHTTPPKAAALIAS